MSVDLQIVANALAETQLDQGPLPSAEQFERWARVALAQVNRLDSVDQHDICIRITDSTESQTLNAQYRHQDKPTNVLSFPADLPVSADTLAAMESIPLGDLVLSLPIIVAEASEQRKPLTDHLAHLVMHGTLHLLGYDHECDDDAQIMESIEIAALAECGIDNPYETESGANS
ncbi:MAG: rRNA maturation RNase YbeY [Pseudomonadales bacterium]